MSDYVTDQPDDNLDEIADESSVSEEDEEDDY
jgi:hypothetical protein